MKQITRQAVISRLPARKISSHKGDFGRVLVLAGSRAMCGAGLLCAKAALQAGAGLVYWALPQTLQPAFAAALPEVIACPLPQTPSGEISARAQKILSDLIAQVHPSLLAVGPGLGDCPFLPKLLQKIKLPLVVDASALTVWVKQQDFHLEYPVILTPHPGEMARLLREEVAIEEPRRAEHVTQLAKRTGGVCVLKGHGTLVAAWQNQKVQLWKNTTGGPSLAKAGSGDVLTGVIAGLWAQLGTAGGFTVQTALQAALCGVYVHGLAGDLAAQKLSDFGVLASDTASCVPAALQQLLS